MKNKIRFNTQGNDKTDESANMGADLDKAGRAEWLASELQKVFENPSKMPSMQCASTKKVK